MSSGRNTVLIYLLVVSGILLAGLIAFAPNVIRVPAVLVALTTLLVLLFRGVISRRQSTPLEEPTSYVSPPPPHVEPRKHRVEQVPVPSQEDDYDFLFSATVLWLPIRSASANTHLNTAGLAVDAIIKRAREITECRRPSRASLVAHELGAALGTMQADETRSVQAMAESVQVILSPRDQERLDKLADVRKDTVVWEHDRKYEQSKREYLGEDVLKDTGSAVVWWLVKNDDHVEKTVNDIGLLNRLSLAANNRELSEPDSDEGGSFEQFDEKPPPMGPSPTDRLSAFLRTLDLDPQEGALFVRQIALLVGQYGRPDTAEDITRRFGVPAPVAPDPDVAEDATHGDTYAFQQNGRNEQI